jgi:hypothetical protein
MRIVEPSFLAGFDLLWLKPDGSEVTITARVGSPYQSDGREYRCPVETIGLDGRYPDIGGESSLQSLCLAIRLLSARLDDVLAKGGRLVHPSDRSLAWDRESLKNVFAR